jgi:hypothetical protein
VVSLAQAPSAPAAARMTIVRASDRRPAREAYVCMDVVSLAE